MKNKKLTQTNKNFNKYMLIAFSLLVLGVIIFASYVLKMEKGNSISPSNSPLLNPARVFLNKEDMIVNIQSLRDEITLLGDKNPNISIYFEFLNTGANIAVNKEAEFFPASLSKLPLALTAVKKIERGEWKWENELVVMPMDKDERFGELYKSPIGTKITIENLIKEILINSDNTAYMMILRNLEPDEFENTQKHLGLDYFFSKQGKISAKNYTVILRSLYNSSYLSPENSEKLIKFMTESTTNEFLSGGLPKGVTFAHKIGISREENVYLDAGIVYLPGRPYFLIVMIDSTKEEIAKSIMTDISKKVYNYIINYKNEN